MDEPLDTAPAHGVKGLHANTYLGHARGVICVYSFGCCLWNHAGAAVVVDSDDAHCCESCAVGSCSCAATFGRRSTSFLGCNGARASADRFCSRGPRASSATASGGIDLGPFAPLLRKNPGVLVAPAQHTPTSTPSGPSSYHSASPSERLNALLAPYVATYGEPQNAVNDDISRIAPRPRCTIAGASTRLTCLVAGTSDLSRDLRARPAPGRIGVISALSIIVIAARAHGLDALDGEVRAAVAGIPEARRKVISTHRAFGYFAAAYGIKFIAPQGVSTESEPSARDIAAIISQIKKQKIPAVFLENVSDPRLMRRIAAETGANIGGTLYSDSLTDEKGPAPTYIDMVRHNIKALTSALSS